MARTRRKKKRTHQTDGQDSGKRLEPKTFVFRRGRHGALLAPLDQDLRRMLLPNTALRLKESNRNVLKDFVSVAGPLGVTHFLILTATEASSYLRVAKVPRGPTLTCRIKGFSLCRDVAASQARPRAPPAAFKTAPLLVMNGFGGEEHLRLATALWQNLLPSINVQRVKLSGCQRVVLLSHDKETSIISLRHYSISVAPSGLRKSLKALLNKRETPDLGGMQDVAEFITRSGYGSESEGEEEGDTSRVELAQDMGRGNVAARQSRIRLHEIGPRLELEVVKAESGLCGGEVLYHAHVSKTPEQVAELRSKVEQREVLRRQRRAQQEANVRRKLAEAKRKDLLAEAAKARREGRAPPGKTWWEEELEAGAQEGLSDDDRGETADTRGGSSRRLASQSADDDEDDVDYFREEVGEEPDEEDKLGMRSSGRGGRGIVGHRGRRGGRGRQNGGSSSVLRAQHNNDSIGHKRKHGNRKGDYGQKRAKK